MSGIRLDPRGNPSPFWTYASPVLALVLTIVVSGAMFLAMGKPPVAAVYTFLVAPLVQTGGLSALAVKAAPLIMMGAGLALCYRASVWNIGCEGQFTVGAICAGGLALALPDLPAPILYPAAMVAGVIGGAATAALTAWLRTSLNVNEILSSLMADLCRAISADLSRHRPVEGPAGLRLPADGDVLGCGDDADPHRRHRRPSRLPRRAAGGDRACGR